LVGWSDVDHAALLRGDAVALVGDEFFHGVRDRKPTERVGDFFVLASLDLDRDLVGESLEVGHTGSDGRVGFGADDSEVIRAARDLDAIHREHGALRRAVNADDEEESLPFASLVEAVDRHAVDPVAVVPLRLHFVESPQLAWAVLGVLREVAVVSLRQRGNQLHHDESAVTSEDVAHEIRDDDTTGVVDLGVDLEVLGPAGPLDLLIVAEQVAEFSVARLGRLDAKPDFEFRMGIDLHDLSS
jgi:hypothetical protein